ncbi:MAG: hypothetical protein J6U43_01415, partial [Bacteroidales bacterium]|nr:hypothetical protein [Bacteroidales bacterium]
MQKRFFLFIATLLTAIVAWAQTGTYITNPSPLNADKEGKITWIDTNKIFGASDELYVHIGVVDATDTWHNGPKQWCDNDAKYKMVKENDNTWSITLGPTIREYFKADIEINTIGVVVRNADGTKQTRPDIMIPCEDGALYVSIDGIPATGIVTEGSSLDLTVNSTKEANLTFIVNGPNGTKEYSASATKSFTQKIEFTTQGDYTFTAKATAGDESHEITANLTACGKVVEATRPAGTIEGINVIDENTVTFVLFDSDKQGKYSKYVFWVGDNNNWKLSNDYIMKRDNTNKCWWITIDGLEPGVEYAFQYHIIPENGDAIRFADPYSTKILDPWNDKWIDESVYPGLREFPTEAWEQPATVFKTTGSDYQWQVNDFAVKNRDNLVIYELLLRDFTKEKS